MKLVRSIAVGAVVLAALLPRPARAEAQSAAPTQTPASTPAWAPPEPKPEQRDWVKLTSGEWLWGDIQSFTDQSLAFDSEKLKEVTLDWDDVVAIRSARALTYTFTADRTATGTAVMQDGVIRVNTAAGLVAYPRTELLKIFEGGEREWDFWSVRASWGVTAQSGNTEQSDFNTLIKLRREAERTRVDLNYNGNYSSVEGAQTANNQRLGATWNYIITRGLFVSPFLGELYQDEFQNISSRQSIGAGLGLWVVRRKAFEWNVQIGGGYRVTHYVSVEPGVGSDDKTGSVVPTTAFEWDVTKDIDLDFKYTAQIGVPDLKDSTHNMQALLSIDIFGDILDVTGNLTWDRIENPRTNAEGIVPKRDDFRLALGLGLDL